MADTHSQQSEFLQIERVLYGFHAPIDGDPQRKVEMMDDDEPVTVNDVHRARMALRRLREAANA